MKKWLSILLVMLLVLSLGLTGCSSQAPADTPAPDEGEVSEASDDVIRIGVFEPITGANAAGGALEVEGVRLANELYPEVLGKRVELVISDNKSDVVEAASAAARLVERDKVTAIIGSWGSGYSIAAGDIVRDAEVPAVAASATNPLVTQGNDYYFRVCFIDPFQGTVMANYAFNNLGAKKAAIMQEVSNDYAVGLAKFFTDSFNELTGDDSAIVEVANYNTGDQDFSSQLLNIAAKNPDVIFAPGNFTESALVIQQARQLGINIPIIGGDTWETPEFIDIGQDHVEGAVFSTFFTSETPITKESEFFLDAYRSKYGKEPAAVTALGYDAYILILDAIERAGTTDTVAIRDEIAKTTGFEGAAGVITLDANGDAVKSAVIKTVKNGEFVYLDTIEPY
ncbi:amino acid/amide ABC transporter substrate-binding protein, HAAT family [Clostridium aceticum]|uniref:Amino acid/amide ABC transporter substrate-binding protein, HAAT family n=1 Tax=Clostridium aceticum TaxID=84022 RepID=A0A0D8I9E6_9CLOT|nr:ABC transporter substrate-binding protein [Clostridium aceticum]AKL93808.1 amino acid/amide ABC transporter substrate-binding protein, HAAT family [Clostridium aceticum]KJF25836.1 branched-chain amino acid ABC transporter substrate-binding protein [Clostridium aceticum]